MLNKTRIENKIPETLIVEGIKYNFSENNDPNANFKPEVKSNVEAITEWVKPTLRSFGSDDVRYSVRITDDIEVPESFLRQNGFAGGASSWWGISDLSELDEFATEVDNYEFYPPAIHGERSWTEKKLSRKNMLNDLLETVGLSKSEWTNAEYKLEDGRRIDVVTETAEGFVSIEAMDSNGKCDDEHFAKGTNSYPMNLREEEGNCVAAIVVAAEFTEAQIRRANEINNVGWMIALVVAEEIDGKTTFTLVN